MAVGPLHVYGNVGAAGAALSCLVDGKVKRPSKIVSIGLTQGGAGAPVAVTVSVEVTYAQGWGPVSYALGSVAVANWAQLQEIPLPIGAKVELKATAPGGAIVVTGVIVIEEHEI